ncbi:MAG: hypothetical protein KGM24_13830, partial [Elusimicrobia bacterium]|nr:hypothetical protein [Elusimicrobiota bacterium]
ARRGDRFVRLSAWYVGLSLAVLPLWPIHDRRYALVLVPFLGALLVRGLESLPRARGARAAAAALVLGLLAVFHARANAGNLADSFRPAPERSVPARTAAFLNARTPPDARILALEAPTFQLYVSRRVLRPADCATSADFLASVRRRGIGWIVFYELDRDWAAGAADADLQSRLARWTAASPLFERVFADPAEETVVYALRAGRRGR